MSPKFLCLGQLYLWLCGVFDGYLKELEFNHSLRAQIRPEIHLGLPKFVPFYRIFQMHSVMTLSQASEINCQSPVAPGIFLEEKNVSSEAVIHPSPHLACFWSSAVKNLTHWRKIVLYFMSALCHHQGTVPSVICSQLCLLIKQEGQLADGLFEANGSSLPCN